jgi:cystathionine beta-lyase
MSHYSFDALIDRHGTHSLKWENPHNVPGKPDVLPLWVADMDFAVLPEIQKALLDRVNHPVFGYMRFPSEYLTAVCSWHARRWKRTLTEKDLVAVPSVMHALSMAVRTFSQPGDQILVQPPVYNPFYRVVTLNDREVLASPLVEPDSPRGAWSFDPDATRRLLKTARNEGKPAKLWLFCSPQNPTGRVWSGQDLDAVEALAEEFDLLLLSDEIHADLINPRVAFLSVWDRPRLAERALIFAGPNKTFNLAGLSLAHVLVRNEAHRLKFRRTVEADFFNEPNVLSIEAALAAYRSGDNWLTEVLEYIGANHEHLGQRLARWNPALTVCPWEGTYLAWADARPLLAQRTYTSEVPMIEAWEKQARVKLTAGSGYGAAGQGWIRINLACPRSILDSALDRIEAFEKTR